MWNPPIWNPPRPGAGQLDENGKGLARSAHPERSGGIACGAGQSDKAHSRAGYCLPSFCVLHCRREDQQMNRREFIGAAAALTAANAHNWEEPLPRRPYKNGINLSIIAMGGIVVCGLSPEEASRRVAQAYDRGVNYFDCAPSYFNGEAETKLGGALRPYRNKVFLAEKTMHRDAKGAREELERTLLRFHTDHVDLYQFHAVSSMDEVDKILSPAGAGEMFFAARKEGKVRHLGFSAHNAPAALRLMDGLELDSVLFPVNVNAWENGGFGPQILDKAKSKGMARMALKALAQVPEMFVSADRQPRDGSLGAAIHLESGGHCRRAARRRAHL
jgi:diketogulonate reductase-like aldo/keto reductase